MEQRKNTIFNDNMDNECRNGYTSSDMYMEAFAKDDDSINNCSNCPSFRYRCGIAFCTKFDK